MPADLASGDILIELSAGEGADHSLMWLADPSKPVVHCVEGEKFKGVMQHSANYFQPHFAKATDASVEWTPKIAVFRSTDGKLAERAAWFAREWATRTDDQACIQLATFREESSFEKLQEYAQQHPRTPRTQPGKNISIGSPKFPIHETMVVLDTPYSQARLGVAAQPWDTLSLFRALRAYHRGINHLPLSQLKGVTCSQFITYCYQAGALALRFGNQPIPKEILNQISDTGVFLSLKKKEKGGADLVRQGLNGYDQDYQQSIPMAMRVDAKTTSADQLLEKLKSDNTFPLAGYMVCLSDKKRLRILTPNEALNVVSWGEVWKIVG
jgi:hypothetical protein